MVHVEKILGICIINLNNDYDDKMYTNVLYVVLALLYDNMIKLYTRR